MSSICSTHTGKQKLQRKLHGDPDVYWKIGQNIKMGTNNMDCDDGNFLEFVQDRVQLEVFVMMMMRNV